MQNQPRPEPDADVPLEVTPKFSDVEISAPVNAGLSALDAERWPEQGWMNRPPRAQARRRRLYKHRR